MMPDNVVELSLVHKNASTEDTYRTFISYDDNDRFSIEGQFDAQNRNPFVNYLAYDNRQNPIYRQMLENRVREILSKAGITNHQLLVHLNTIEIQFETRIDKIAFDEGYEQATKQKPIYEFRIPFDRSDSSYKRPYDFGKEIRQEAKGVSPNLEVNVDPATKEVVVTTSDLEAHKRYLIAHHRDHPHRLWRRDTGHKFNY